MPANFEHAASDRCGRSRLPHVRMVRAALQRELPARCSGNNGRWSDLCGKSY
jgi:hypothetical protein